MAIAWPAAQVKPTMRDHGFHQLRIARVVRETPDAASFVLEVPTELAAAFTYRAGQFCTFRVRVDGQPHFRSYSMSSSPEVDTELQVTVKRVPGGVVSNWMIDTLSAGDVIESSCPAGVFCLGPDGGDVVAFAAGSGITPVFSIVKTALATTSRRVHLLYANRDRDSVIFAAELERLAERHPGRLTVVHHLDVYQGFVDRDEVHRFASIVARPAAGQGPPPLGGGPGWGPARGGEAASSTDAEYFVCGPAPFMDIVESTLLGRDVDERHILIERFTPPEPSEQPEPDGTAPTGSRVTIELGGRTDTVDHHPGTTILQTARQMSMSPPSSCEAGNCATCMARVVEGAVSMHVNDALTDDEVAEGWVLTCQSVPTTPSVRVVYEEV